MITFESIEAFVCIVESKSFRSAAKILNKSQPALTYHIKQLETYLGYELFNRSQYRVQLTANGMSFLPKAIRTIEAVSDMENDRHSSDHYYEPELKVSVSSLYPIERLSRSLHQVQTRFPETSCQLATDTLAGHDKVRKNDVDIAITEFADQDISLLQEPVFEFDMVLAIAQHHDLNNSSKVAVSDLLQYPQIVLKSSGDAVEDRGVLSSAKQWRVSDMGSKFNLIKMGLGWGYLPDYLLNEMNSEKKFSAVRVEELPAVQVTMYKTVRRYKKRGPVLRAFWDAVSITDS